MAVSKLEARIVVPSGGWTVSVTDSGGTDATAISLAAAETYYHSSVGTEVNDLPAEMQSQLNASGTLAGIYTVTADAGAGGTGRYTIACNESYSLTWTSTDLRNAVGFAANISSQTSVTGANHAEGLWLPNCPYNAEIAPIDANTAGNTESQVAVSEAADGTFSAYVGDSRVRNTLLWGLVEQAKIWLSGSPTYTNQTLQEFWDDAVRGTEPWAANPAHLIKFYPDADDDAVFQAYNFLQPNIVPARKVDDTSTLWWAVEIQVGQ